MFLKIPDKTRHEIKFVSYETNYNSIINWIKLNKYNFFREYKSRIVNNIYFDNLSYDAFKANLFGSSSRLKIRYRWYGNLTDNQNGDLEFKFKRNIFGWKKRFHVENLKINSKIEWKKIVKNITNNLNHETKILYKSNSTPMIINQYLRDYFTSIDKKFRITVDRNHYVWDQRFKKKPNLKNKIKLQPIIIVEFKFDRNMESEMNKLMRGMPIRVSRSSKYINSIRAVTGI